MQLPACSEPGLGIPSSWRMRSSDWRGESSLVATGSGYYFCRSSQDYLRHVTGPPCGCGYQKGYVYSPLATEYPDRFCKRRVILCSANLGNTVMVECATIQHLKGILKSKNAADPLVQNIAATVLRIIEDIEESKVTEQSIDYLVQLLPPVYEGSDTDLLVQHLTTSKPDCPICEALALRLLGGTSHPE